MKTELSADRSWRMNTPESHAHCLSNAGRWSESDGSIEKAEEQYH